MKVRKTARDCALFLLEHGDRTEQEMRQKLKDREYEPQEIEETLAFLKEYHFINDADYTEKYIRVNSSLKSTRQIQYQLLKKGIDGELIAKYLAEAPVDEEGQIRKLLEKKGYRPGEKPDPDAYRRMMGSLARKGFSYEAIRRVMNRICEEEYLT